MKNVFILPFLLALFFTLSGMSQGTPFTITYDFTSSTFGDNRNIVTSNTGSIALDAEPAYVGGAKMTGSTYTTLNGKQVLQCRINSNNATNYVNTYLRINIKPLMGYTFVITSFKLTQSSSITGGTLLFRQGANLNSVKPNTTYLGSSTGNLPFLGILTENVFTPSVAFATGKNTDYVTLWASARGGDTDIFDWNIDKVVIEGEYISTTFLSAGSVFVTQNIKQQLRFGIDAEVLWYWRTGTMGQTLANLGVKDLNVEYVRVGIDCAYEREEGNKVPAAYDKILDMMTAMKTANPNVLFFASPLPLDYAYTSQEIIDIWGGKCPWSPSPAWIITWVDSGTKTSEGFTKWNFGSLNEVKLIQYYADYLNFMHDKGFKIDYMDVSNEFKNISQSTLKRIFDDLPGLLDPGVYMPKLIGPSSWGYEAGIDYLNGATTSQLAALTIAASHNTSTIDTPTAHQDFANLAVSKSKEPWNTELHKWVGIDIQTEVTTSEVFFEHIRSGFVGLDTWLFYGPKTGKDHTMIWSDGNTYIKSSKYEIFKKVVNESNGGNYTQTNQPSGGFTTASFKKGNVLLVCVLNKSNFDYPDSTIGFNALWDITNKPIEITEYRGGLPREGVVSSSTSTTQTFTHTIKGASLYIFKIDLGTLDTNDITESKSMSVYPNPTENILYIKDDINLLTNTTYNIYSIEGRLVSQGILKDKSISTSNLPTGLYLLKLKTIDKTSIFKFLIK